ncbi:MAG: YitT family protein [Emergencia sp.]
MILTGLAMAAFGVVAFILPNSIIIGSATGIGRFLEHFYGIPVSATVVVVNTSLFILGLILLGKSFAASIVIGTFAYPVFMRLFEGIEAIQHITYDPIIAAIYGGAFVGVGVGLVIKAGASTGGTDVIAVICQRKLGIPVGVTMYFIDFLILVSQIIIADSYDVILLGIITTVLYSIIAQKVVIMGGNTVQLIVVSKHYGQIRKMLANMVIGTSVLYGESGYYAEKREILLCVISARELKQVQDAILSMDSEAFMVISSVKEVKGRGYTFDIGRAQQIRKELKKGTAINKNNGCSA